MPPFRTKPRLSFFQQCKSQRSITLPTLMPNYCCFISKLMPEKSSSKFVSFLFSRMRSHLKTSFPQGVTMVGIALILFTVLPGIAISTSAGFSRNFTLKNPEAERNQFLQQLPIGVSSLFNILETTPLVKVAPLFKPFKISRNILIGHPCRVSQKR